MPELPEVLTIKKDLKKEIKGKKIISIDPDILDLKEKIIGFEVVEISNIAKLLTIELSSGYFIATHLNMSGILLYNNEDPHIKFSLKFDTEDALHYSSVRMFGFFEVWSKEKIEEYKSRYGKEILDTSLTVEEFIQKIRSKKTYIKNALLDQKLVSGAGNIYVNDSLYISGIHPRRRTKDLVDKELKNIFENLKLCITDGIKHRGSSIDRYRDIYGKKGSHQLYFKIYGKKNNQCKTCNTQITYEKFQGRPTYYCPKCQPLDNQQAMF